METQLWAIAIKGSSSPAELKNAVGQLANVHSFKVPASGLRVGTLDSLMSLSDDLAKMDILAEATVSKMYKQLLDLKPDEEPTIIGGARATRGRCAASLPHGVSRALSRSRFVRAWRRLLCALMRRQPASACAAFLLAARALSRASPRYSTPSRVRQCPSPCTRRCNGSGTRPSSS